MYWAFKETVCNVLDVRGTRAMYRTLERQRQCTDIRGHKGQCTDVRETEDDLWTSVLKQGQ